MPHKDPEAEKAWRRKWSRQKYANDPKYKAANQRRKRKHKTRCRQCGVEFMGRKDAKFCTRQCSAAWMWQKGKANRFVQAKPNKGARYKIVKAPDHPMAMASGWIYEHRLIMANHLGRMLDRTEHVHHINRAVHPAECRIRLLAEHLIMRGCNRHDVVALRLEVLRYEASRLVRVGSGADHGDGPGRCVDIAQS